jgi:hypothetical protein
LKFFSLDFLEFTLAFLHIFLDFFEFLKISKFELKNHRFLISDRTDPVNFHRIFKPWSEVAGCKSHISFKKSMGIQTIFFVILALHVCRFNIETKKVPTKHKEKLRAAWMASQKKLVTDVMFLVEINGNPNDFLCHSRQTDL